MKSPIIKLQAIPEIMEEDKGFITYKEKTYFYKRCNNDLCYRELIAYEIATFLNIPSVFYSLVEIPNAKADYDIGVIAENYKRSDLYYINGLTLLKDYHYDYLKNWYKRNNYRNNFNYNTLNDIWNALEFRYRFEENRADLVKKILTNIINNIFLFDIFTKNADRNFNNWELVENIETGEVNTNKLYDNEDIFLGNNYQVNSIIVNPSNRKCDWYTHLREFLIVSDGEYLNTVVNIYNKLTPNVLASLIELAERRHKMIIPLSTKNDILTKYEIHYQKIGLIISEFNKQLKRILV